MSPRPEDRGCVNSGAMTEFEIRPASEADAHLILAFVKLIAENDGDLDDVVATEDDVRQALFGERAHAEGVIAYQAGEPAGCAVFCPKYSSYTGKIELYLEDLAVSPGARGKGIGRKLLQHVARVAVERGATRLEWFVTRTNSSAIAFYQSLGARALDQVSVMRLEGGGLTELAGQSR